MHALKMMLIFSSCFCGQTMACCSGRSGSNNVVKILHVLQHVTEKVSVKLKDAKAKLPGQKDQNL